MIEATAFETREFLFDALGGTSDGEMLSRWATAQGAPEQCPAAWYGGYGEIAFCGDVDVAAAHIFFQPETSSALVGGLITNPALSPSERHAAAVFIMDWFIQWARAEHFNVIVVKAATVTDEKFIEAELARRANIQREISE